MNLDPPKLQADPMFTQLQDKARNDEIVATQHQLQGDTASLMARYGTRLTLASLATPSQAPLANNAGAASLAPFGRVA